MKKQLTVVKLGGNAIDDAGMLAEFLRQFSLLPGIKLLVHGGGKLASALCTQLGIGPEMRNGRRITDEATLEVVTMVYAGLVNKKIVATLQGMNCNALGLSGADGNLISAARRNPVPVDYGFAGDPQSVNVEALSLLLDAGFTPVVSPITHDCSGQLLNTNADTVASVVASALNSTYDVQLIFAFEKAGVLSDPTDNGSLIPELSRDLFASLQRSGKIHSGMLPKLEAGFCALSNEVSTVAVKHLHALHGDKATHLVL